MTHARRERVDVCALVPVPATHRADSEDSAWQTL